MSQVGLTIGGRNYTVACSPGEEAHVRTLAAAIDAKVSQLGDNRSPQDSQNLLFAALLLADELHDNTAKLAAGRDALDRAEAEFATERGDLERAVDTAKGQHDAQHCAYRRSRSAFGRAAIEPVGAGRRSIATGKRRHDAAADRSIHRSRTCPVAGTFRHSAGRMREQAGSESETCRAVAVSQ